MENVSAYFYCPPPPPTISPYMPQVGMPPGPMAENAMKRKIKTEPGESSDSYPLNPGGKKIKQEKITDHLPVKKKRDRFNGMSEEEVMKKTLPDHLLQDLDIIIVGINPGLTAAYVGHHYAGPGNHFWKCLYLSGLIPEPMNAYDDRKLLEFGIGFTNIVERTTKGSADLTRKEIKEGAELLAEKLKKFKPKIVAFNGKGIYEIFVGHKKFHIGKQPDPLEGTDTTVYVMPSSSARCSQLPRAVDKVPFYVALKKLRDYRKGDMPDLDFAEVCFPDLELKVRPKAEPEEEPRHNMNNQNGIKQMDHWQPELKDFNSVNHAGGSHMGMAPPHPATLGYPGYDRSPPGSIPVPYVKQEKVYDSDYGMMPCSNYQPSLMYASPNMVASPMSAQNYYQGTYLPAEQMSLNPTSMYANHPPTGAPTYNHSMGSTAFLSPQQSLSLGLPPSALPMICKPEPQDGGYFTHCSQYGMGPL